ncbi:hypothetical protein PG984_016374 [Apiospora sp. TS-2023a]
MAEYMALAGAVNTYWLLDSTASPTPETYCPKLVGYHVGPNLGLLGTHGSSMARAPFQRQSNVLRHWNRTEYHDTFDKLSVLSERKITLFTIIPLSMIYGGLHCTAWVFHFPSQLEELFVVAALCLILMMVLPFEVCGIDFVELILAAAGICFVVPRTFLVVESFISLRSLPVGAYIMPGWLQMIPHL